MGRKVAKRGMKSLLKGSGKSKNGYGWGNAAADYLMDHVGGFKKKGTKAKRVKTKK